MTLGEIARALPHGFHDAEVATITIDYVARRAVIQMEVWVADLATSEAGQDAYRRAELVLEGLAFLVIDAPEPSHPFGEAGPIRIDLSIVPTAKEVAAIAKLPAGCFAASFFVMDWSSMVYVSARTAELKWLGEPYDRRLRIQFPRP